MSASKISSRFGNSKLNPHPKKKLPDCCDRELRAWKIRKTKISIKESRFDLAYNAAHALSLAALRAAGYRSENRYLVFQCTQHTLNIEPEQWRVLDQAHRKRNLAEYEGDIDVDDELLEALIRVVDLIAGKQMEINDNQ